MIRILLAAVVVLPTAALADAVTYKGTLGTHAIVVELSGPVEEASEPFVGRYFYLSQGVDIPLQPVTITPGAVELREEKPCVVEACSDYVADASTITPEFGGSFRLTAQDSGQTLRGEWREGDGEPLPVALEFAGTRPLPEPFEGTPQALAAIVDEIGYGGVVLSEETSPYDYLKMRAPLEEGPEEPLGIGAYRVVTDPRTTLAFPRLVRAAGADTGPANAFLEARHRQLGTAALQCKSQQYRGLSWAGQVPFGAGTLGGYEDEQVEATYLSPTLFGWTESGSLFCGGAHPYNHQNSYTLDLATGELFDVGKVLVASEALYAYVRDNRDKSEPAFDAECGIDELIEENLKLSFRDGDMVVFSLEGLPHVIGACEGPLLEVPLADLKAFLAPEAAAYFPGLGG